MKRILTTAMALALMAAPAWAQQKMSKGNMYAGGALSLSLPGDKESSGVLIFPYTATQSFDPGFEISGFIGYRAAPNVRVEGEIGYSMNDLGDYEFVILGVPTVTDMPGTLSVLSVMASAWFDFSGISGFTPYAGGGIGFASAEIADVTGSPDESDSGFAWQLGLGAGYEMSPGMNLDIRYRLLSASYSFSNFGGYDEFQHKIGVGLQVFF